MAQRQEQLLKEGKGLEEYFNFPDPSYRGTEPIPGDFSPKGGNDSPHPSPRAWLGQERS